MLQSEFLELNVGDQVVYTDSLGDGTCDKGTILTRKESWLDDKGSVKFTFTNALGEIKSDFFEAEEIEFIKG